VVAALWARDTGVAATPPIPQLRSGLALQRCSGGGLSNQYGRWRISQSNADAAAAGGQYSSTVGITYDPAKEKVDCKEISFVQSVRILDKATKKSAEYVPNYVNRLTGTGWTLDRIDKRKYGWYGYNDDGKPSGTVSPGSSPAPLKSATMTDVPRDSLSNVTWGFETCAVCKDGTDVSKVFGCLAWGFDVDASNKLTSLKPSLQDAPSAEFNESVVKWNAQAAGPAAQRNAPDQVPLGPFK
jgi:hypothetical protein